MSIKHRLAALAVVSALATTGLAVAQDHSYSEGPIVNISMIRTVDGKFDDYMKWVDTVWKEEEEAAKKTGYILDYQVVSVEPHGPDEPDLMLIVTYKNWAAMDGSLAKGDAIAKQIEGSVSAANKAQADRASLRRVIGVSTGQRLILN